MQPDYLTDALALFPFERVDDFRFCGSIVAARCAAFLYERGRGIVAQAEPGSPSHMPVVARLACYSFALPSGVGEAKRSPVPFPERAGHMSGGRHTKRLAY